MAIQCISSILMKYYPNAMSPFIQFLFLSKKTTNKTKLHTVNHRVPWTPVDSTSRRIQARENNSRITEMRLLFRCETWNYLHSGGTLKGTLQQSPASVHVPGQTETAKGRDLHPLLSEAGHQGIRSNVHQSCQEQHQLKWPWGQKYCFRLLPVSCPLKGKM